MSMKRWDFLIDQIQQNNYKVGVEVGVQSGQTFKKIIQQCPDVTLYGVDVWVADKNVRLENRDLEGHDYHENFGKLQSWINEEEDRAKRAVMIRSYSDGCLDQFVDESLDFIFIDADHSYECVRKDTLNWSKKVREGGLVVGHDSGFETISRWLTEITSSITLQSAVGLDRKIVYAPDNVWWYRKRRW